MQQITLQVFAWGNNSLGQLGLNDTANRRAPAPVEALWAIPVAQLAAGEAHSAALTINGFLFTWGHNEKGQLGLAAGADAVAQARVVSSTQAKLHFTPRRMAQIFTPRHRVYEREDITNTRPVAPFYIPGIQYMK